MKKLVIEKLKDRKEKLMEIMKKNGVEHELKSKLEAELLTCKFEQENLITDLKQVLGFTLPFSQVFSNY